MKTFPLFFLSLLCLAHGSTLLAQNNKPNSIRQSSVSSAGERGKNAGENIIVQEEHEHTLSADSLITSSGELDSIYRSLPEVLITGERPIVKAESGKLIYDLPRIIGSMPVDNAYDALKEIPGVTEMNNRLMLGGESVTVVLEGKVSRMNTAQLYAILKSIPAGRIDKVEVMYNAPARYQVRGALINITLKQHTTATPSMQGEVYTKYRQEWYESFEERTGLIYSHKGFSGDFIYSHKHGNSRSTTEKEALHSLNDGSTHPFETDEKSRIRSHKHDLRLGLDYRSTLKHTFSLVYDFNYSTRHRNTNVQGSQQSDTNGENSDLLHGIRFDYKSPFGLTAGAEWLYYRSPSAQVMHSIMQGKELHFKSEDRQHIEQRKIFLAHEHKLWEKWKVNYGTIYSTGTDKSYQIYRSAHNATGTGTLPADMHSERREKTWNLYAGISRNFGSTLSLDASLAAERYQTAVWNRWDWYPSLNIQYIPSPGSVWQLSVSSDKRYPDYWAVQDVVSYIGSYSEIHGNPMLKPAQAYNVRLNHIIGGKYVLSAWASYTKHYSTQTLYQSPERLVEIYKYLNFDYTRKAGIQASIPLKKGNWLQSRLTLIGVWMHEKDSDFWNLSFDRKICYGMALVNNTFTLSSRPDLKLTLAGMIRSKAIQGVYDLPASGYVNTGLRYAFAKQRAVLNLYCNDLFETTHIDPRIRYATQRVVNHYASFREFGISFTYRFGSYKAKNREDIDTSRLK